MLRYAPLTLSLCSLLGALACSQPRDSDRAVGGSSGSSGGSNNGGSRSLGGAGLEDGDAGSSGVSGASEGSGAPGASGSSGVSGVSGGGGAPGGSQGGGAPGASPSLLVFSRTAAYRHDSIPDGVQALRQLALTRGWQLAASEDSSQFSDAALARYNVVVFLSTTGDVLDDAQQAAFERFIRAGNGFIGIHSASDTEYDWSWYGGLVGAYFREHPTVQAADVVREDATNPASIGLPNRWHRTDEWYAFQSNPRANVHVLLSLDETSYAAGTAHMNGDHPIAWCHEYDGGRAFYTALGHTSESFTDPLFIGQLAGAVTWVLSR